MAHPKEKDPEPNAGDAEARALSRRDFLERAGVLVVGATVCVAGCESSGGGGSESGEVAASKGFLLVDTKKCQGCLSCMLICSVVNEGVASLSLSRIQVMQNSFIGWPGDLSLVQCRQCSDPACVEACPAGALTADRDEGNVRRVDRDKCIGCGACAAACPYAPSRSHLEPDPAKDGALKSRKCDLCASAPHHFSEEGGGPGGVQACVSVCPVRAIAFTDEMPEQKGNGGYDVNLRNKIWGQMGYPTAD